MTTWRTRKPHKLTAGTRYAIALANGANATTAHLAGMPGTATKCITPAGSYIFLTKLNHLGQIGERSIGLPAADLPELMAILDRCND